MPSITSLSYHGQLHGTIDSGWRIESSWTSHKRSPFICFASKGSGRHQGFSVPTCQVRVIWLILPAVKRVFNQWMMTAYNSNRPLWHAGWLHIFPAGLGDSSSVCTENIEKGNIVDEFVENWKVLSQVAQQSLKNLQEGL